MLLLLKNKLIQRTLLIGLLLLALFTPTLGFAQVSGMGKAVINPSNGNAWVIYVYGNAQVIQDLFMAIKLMVNPDAGQTFFISLMYLIAIVGFFVLAVAAGFDPGKNFMRMFTYILVVWAVVFSTTKLAANVMVIDKLNPPLGGVTTVSGVPALIAIPASLVSQVGDYFAKSVETYFTIPGFEMSKVGQFNLFSTMAKDAMSYRLTDNNIKKTLNAYVADCVIPGLALGRISGPVNVAAPSTGIIAGVPPTPKIETASGIDAIMRTTDLLKTYGTAATDAIFTRYFSPSKGSAVAAPASGASSPSLVTSDFGQVVTCQTAYTALVNDVSQHADSLLNASSEQWGASGGSAAYSQMFNMMLASASSTENGASFIRQKSLVSSVAGTFRGAAVQAGNNDMLQTLAIEQAQQQQKSMMVSAFEVFNNMMGYMYTVLQAFMYGMAPIIILAMLVPGLGKNILVNYMQVLIWLALWAPLLGIVNYIITLFAQYDLAKAFMIAGGGLNTTNDGVISEKANNMIIAGQFLGTLVPMISWGIIKGAMAFTEFINHGIGSQFAAQAGATAATGNYSLNNASADNLSMNKFSTVMSSAVGAEAVKGMIGAGAGQTTGQTGGTAVTGNNGQALNMSTQMGSTAQKGIEMSKTYEQAISNAMSAGLNIADVHEMAKAKAFGKDSAEIANRTKAIMETTGDSKTSSFMTKLSEDDRKQLGQAMQNATATQGGLEFSSKDVAVVGNILKKAGIQLKGGATLSSQVMANAGITTGTGASKDTTAVTTQQAGNGAARTDTAGETNGTHIKVDSSVRDGHSEQATRQASLAAALKEAQSLKESYSQMESLSRTMNKMDDQDMYEVRKAMAEMDKREFMSADQLRASVAGIVQAVHKMDAQAEGAGLVGPGGAPKATVPLGTAGTDAARAKALEAGRVVAAKPEPVGANGSPTGPNAAVINAATDRELGAGKKVVAGNVEAHNAAAEESLGRAKRTTGESTVLQLPGTVEQTVKEQNQRTTASIVPPPPPARK